MSMSATPTERDLRTLAGIVTDHRADVPKDGLPRSLLADLMGQIRCDVIAFQGFDSQQPKTWFVQSIPTDPDDAWFDQTDPVHWQHYWQCQPCSHPDRTGDLRSIIKIADFYTARQWHSTGMYCDIYRPGGWSTS